MANGATVYTTGVAVTTSDTADLAPFQASGRLTDALYVGGAGIVEAVFQDGAVVAFTAAAGAILPLAIRRVNATSSTATLMVALYQG